MKTTILRIRKTLKDNILIIYVTLIITLLTIANISLLLQLNEFKSSGERFTYADGMALHNVCHNSGIIQKSTIMDIYGLKETNFKKYLLLLKCKTEEEQ